MRRIRDAAWKRLRIAAWKECEGRLVRRTTMSPRLLLAAACAVGGALAVHGVEPFQREDLWFSLPMAASAVAVVGSRHLAGHVLARATWWGIALGSAFYGV